MPDNSLESHRLPISIRGVEQSGQVAAQEPLEQPLWYRALRSFYSDTGNALPGPAIAVSPESVSVFTKAMQEAPAITNNALINKAAAFLTTRYPRFASQVPVVASEANQLAPKVRGLFTGSSGEPYVMVNPQRATSIPEIIQTLAHEMLHARQFAQGGETALTEEAQRGVPYMQRLIEQNARKAGATAHISYQDYLKLLQPELPSWTSVGNLTPQK
jgi:hypothetical protein